MNSTPDPAQGLVRLLPGGRRRQQGHLRVHLARTAAPGYFWLKTLKKF
jgi:hypothetical protein